MSVAGPNFDSSYTTACAPTCQQLWEQAVARGVSPDGYDEYETGAERGECSHWQAEFSADALHVVDTHLRRYVIVDACSDCGADVGEQSFLFRCPLPLSD
ncbi:MAG: hypothetical protein ABI602_01945 [Candidatus Saccharibacteria bacterium]